MHSVGESGYRRALYAAAGGNRGRNPALIRNQNSECVLGVGGHESAVGIRPRARGHGEKSTERVGNGAEGNGSDFRVFNSAGDGDLKQLITGFTDNWGENGNE